MTTNNKNNKQSKNKRQEMKRREKTSRMSGSQSPQKIYFAENNYKGAASWSIQTDDRS